MLRGGVAVAVFVVAGLFSGASAVVGQSYSATISPAAATAEAPSPDIAARKALFKQMADAAQAPREMLKGDVAFDPVSVKDSLAIIADAASQLSMLFPENSQTGDTAALPLVWEKQAEFDARFERLNRAAATAIVSITDEATFKTAMPRLLDNCSGCHKAFKKPS